MNDDLSVGDKVIDSWDRVGRVEQVHDDGRVTVDLTSQYWDARDKVVTTLTRNDVKKLRT